MAVADFLSRNGGGGGGGLQAGGFTGLRRAVGVCGEGGRGKAERTKGRAGSEMSGESVGK